jgi:AraC family transcriptional regulator
MVDMDTGRDRLRELLDAVLAEADAGSDLETMAGRAYASPFHFSRQLRKGAGEPPVAMRRRVMLERAAWQLRRGSSVTDAAFAAGYESVEGFARAFARAYGHPPSETANRGEQDHWLPAPNGIHFHPPTSLWVHAREQERPMNPVTELMVAHDLDDTRALLEEAKALDQAAYRREHLPGTTITTWDGEEASVAAVLDRIVWTREVWLAAIDGADTPDRGADDVAALLARHDAVAPRWRAVWRDVDRREGWDDVLVDALCDPPESFVMSSVIAHVLTFTAHRRQLVRLMLRAGGHAVDDGDPIMWLRSRVQNEDEDPR